MKAALLLFLALNGQDPGSFGAFRTKLRPAIERKDLDVLRSILAPEIFIYTLIPITPAEAITFFEGPQGHEFWRSVQNALLFDDMDGSTDEFCGPNLADSDFLISGNNVRVHAAPSVSSPTIETLSSGPVQRADSANDDYFDAIGGEVYKWYYVATPSGKQGYVWGKYVADQFQLEVCFSNDGTDWQLTSILSEDRRGAIVYPFQRLEPKDESDRDPSFAEFRTRALEAAANKDNSFHPEPDYMFWRDLRDYLKLGAVQSDNDRWCAPYPCAAALETPIPTVITGSNVPIRSAPALGSPVIETLSYDLVELGPGDGYADRRSQSIDDDFYHWRQIITPSGKLGYVLSKYVYSRFDRGLAFGKVDGRWRITSTAAVRKLFPVKLYPTDQSHSDPSFAEFKTKLIEAARKHDDASLVKVMGERVEIGNSHYSPLAAVAIFNGPGTRFWSELEEALTYGARREDNTFCAPYPCGFPDLELDRVVISSANVPLLAAPDPSAKVLATLSFDVLAETQGAVTRNNDWWPVTTRDGVSGYVARRYAFPTRQFCTFLFRLHDGQWKLDAIRFESD